MSVCCGGCADAYIRGRLSPLCGQYVKVSRWRGRVKWPTPFLIVNGSGASVGGSSTATTLSGFSIFSNCGAKGSRRVTEDQSRRRDVISGFRFATVPCCEMGLATILRKEKVRQGEFRILIL